MTTNTRYPVVLSGQGMPIDMMPIEGQFRERDIAHVALAAMLQRERERAREDHAYRLRQLRLQLKHRERVRETSDRSGIAVFLGLGAILALLADKNSPAVFVLVLACCLLMLPIVAEAVMPDIVRRAFTRIVGK